MMRQALLAVVLLGSMLSAWSADYRSVEPAAAILYDSPSQKAKKLFLIKAKTPVEVLVRLEGWQKVRDAEGSLAWIEARYLSEKRTLVVTAARAELRQSDKADAPILAVFERSVGFDLLEPAALGWAKVKHRDGLVGYIRSTQVWGL